MKRLLFLIIIVIFCSDCGCFRWDYNPCEKRMKQAIREMGQPDEINKYNSGSYFSESWWWWDQGLNYTWTWGRNIGGCRKSTYKTSSVYKPITEVKKATAQEIKVLITTEVFDRDCIFCP